MDLVFRFESELEGELQIACVKAESKEAFLSSLNAWIEAWAREKPVTEERELEWRHIKIGQENFFFYDLYKWNIADNVFTLQEWFDRNQRSWKG